MNNKIINQFYKINNIANIERKNYKVKGTYYDNECIFLLKDLTNTIKEISIKEKENLIKKGVNYSEILSKEEPVPNSYNKLFMELLNKRVSDIAEYIATMGESIYNEKGSNTVIVSLARAGTPFGILVKDYIKYQYNVDIPHYSISIIRGKGIDENALVYILYKHPNAKIQFVDGWTGKGSITFELQKSIKEFNFKYDVSIDSNLAVLADPAKISYICGTRKDIIIPNCCLNSTVSGLISRTYHNPKDISEYDFHGVKVYWKFINEDYSRCFLEKIRSKLINIKGKVIYHTTENYGQSIIDKIAKEFNVSDKNKIKLSIGETSRVLLRRIPKYLLIKNVNNPDIKHLLFMAKEKNVKIIHYDKTDYEVISIIKE